MKFNGEVKFGYVSRWGCGIGLDFRTAKADCLLAREKAVVRAVLMSDKEYRRLLKAWSAVQDIIDRLLKPEVKKARAR